MKKITKVESFFDYLISLNELEIRLLMKMNTRSSIKLGRCHVNHTLSYEKDQEIRYNFEHRDIVINSLNQSIFAPLLYRDLTKVLEQERRLKEQGIEILLGLNGLMLPYLGHGDYSNNGYLDILALPNLLLAMKQKYRLK